MTPKLIEELRDALQDNAGKPTEIEDAQTHQVYVLMTRDEFRRLVYDDSDVTEEEMLAIAEAAFADLEGWEGTEREHSGTDQAGPSAP